MKFLANRREPLPWDYARHPGAMHTTDTRSSSPGNHIISQRCSRMRSGRGTQSVFQQGGGRGSEPGNVVVARRGLQAERLIHGS